MKITVTLTGPHPDGPPLFPVHHTADWVDYDVRDGELRVTEYDIHGDMSGWTLYAAGQWLRACLAEPPTAEVVKQRRAREERERGPVTAPLRNGGAVLGNSGPY